MKKTRGGVVVIVGATSAIGRELARRMAKRGTPLVLLARRRKEAEDIAADLEVRFRADPATGKLDVLDFDAGELRRDLEEIDDLRAVILCVGYLGDSMLAATDEDEATRILDANFTGPAAVLDIAADVLERRGKGYICALSSVAGDRPRRRVMAYGVAKQKLNEHLARLRKQLRPRNVRVITVKLGPVDTRMPYGDRRQPFTVSPEAAAAGIARILDTARGVVYVPRKWRLIMAIVRALPAPLYRRMDL